MTRLELYEYLRNQHLLDEFWTDKECAYVLECLECPEADAFLRRDMKQHIQELLEERISKKNPLPYFRKGVFAQSKMWENRDEKFVKKLRNIKNLVGSKRYFQYENETKNGQRIAGMGFPISIEVDPLTRRWSFFFMDVERKTLVLANLERIQIIRVLSCPPDRGKEYLDMAEAMKNRKVWLEISCEKNGLERCCAVFSGYDREIEYPVKNGKIQMTLRYYAFDEAQIIQEILALGNYVRVIGPDAVKDQVIMEIKKSLEFCTLNCQK